MAISAQTLFHFTKYQYLKSIIKAKAFYPRYCFESFVNQDNYIVLYPMSCFCDIPLSQIYSHAETYNRNGIGLKKGWGVEKGLNPVFYLQKESIPAKSILESFRSLLKSMVQNEDGTYALKTENPYFLSHFFELLNYYKPREGKRWIKELCDFEKYTGAISGDKIINFYDEREWRYVPNGDDMIDNNHIRLNFRLKEHFYVGKTFLEREFERVNSELEGNPLSFTAEDVKYIIVSRTSGVNYFANFIKGLPDTTYSKEEKNILISRIISLTQIKEDF